MSYLNQLKVKVMKSNLKKPKLKLTKEDLFLKDGKKNIIKLKRKLKKHVSKGGKVNQKLLLKQFHILLNN